MGLDSILHRGALGASLIAGDGVGTHRGPNAQMNWGGGGPWHHSASLQGCAWSLLPAAVQHKAAFWHSLSLVQEAWWNHVGHQRLGTRMELVGFSQG